MPFAIRNTALHHLRAKSDRVIKTAWGVMRDRHAVFIALQSSDNHTGVGESWCNFPTWSPLTRSAAFEQAYFPYLQNREVSNVKKFMVDMTRAFLGVAVQANCVGSLIAELCAIELALYDLEAQSKNLPLHKLWFPNSSATEIQVYASGINSPLPMLDIDNMLAAGVKLFKLKLGFGDEDLPNIKNLTAYLAKNHAKLAVDTNRAWSIYQALEWLPILSDHNIAWLEEPLLPDYEFHYPQLHEAAKKAGVNLAAGENVWVHTGKSLLELMNIPVDILQPDITKNVAPSAAVELISRIPLEPKNKRVIPHFLGSAIGQAASLHLASGCTGGGDALVEWDINPNPLRTDLLGPDFKIQNGKIKIPTAPGLGWPLDLKHSEFRL